MSNTIRNIPLSIKNCWKEQDNPKLHRKTQKFLKGADGVYRTTICGSVKSNKLDTWDDVDPRGKNKRLTKARTSRAIRRNNKNPENW